MLTCRGQFNKKRKSRKQFSNLDASHQSSSFVISTVKMLAVEQEPNVCYSHNKSRMKDKHRICRQLKMPPWIELSHTFVKTNSSLSIDVFFFFFLLFHRLKRWDNSLNKFVMVSLKQIFIVFSLCRGTEVCMDLYLSRVFWWFIFLVFGTGMSYVSLKSVFCRSLKIFF